eukprot:jgi/Phyca11/22103/fgenesh1_pg.PHYCAscaffold_699_\
MSVYTKFAIIGAGGVGGTVADELLKKGDVSVTILTRDESKPELQAFKARGATLYQVSYEDEDAVKKALSGSEVAVSTVSPFNMTVQKAIVPAAKAAGIQLGLRTRQHGWNLLHKDDKKLLQDMSQGGGGAAAAAAAAGGGAGAGGGGNANQAAGAAIRQVIKGNSKAPRLEDSFEVYRVEVQMYLEDREAWDVVTGAEVRHANDAALQADFDRKDRLARSTILRGLRGCQDDEAEKICTMATSKDMWDTIVADKTQRDF